jgi:DNA-binding NarL/FixJ family response regulator
VPRIAVIHDAKTLAGHDDVAVRSGVLIVDDHPDFREAARAMLEAAGFEVVGEAADGEEAMRADRRTRPAVVLLDIQLPQVDGFQVAERLAAEPDPPVVVLVSSREAAAYGDRVALSPARGFISKVRLSGATLAALVE